MRTRLTASRSSDVRHRLGEIAAGGGWRQRFAVSPVQLDGVVNDATEIVAHLLLVGSVTTSVDEASELPT